MNRALIVEDHEAVRVWLAALLSRAVPGIAMVLAGSVAEARRFAEREQFDLALLDIGLPDGNGVDLVEVLRRQHPPTYCVMATIVDDDEHVFRALRAGAQGYLLKDEPEEQLLAGLHGILNGSPPLSPAVARRVLRHFAAAPEPVASRLSDREQEILTLLAKGLNRGEIAHALGIGVSTVATHVGGIYRKLHISSRSEATVEAIRLGLLRPLT